MLQKNKSLFIVFEGLDGAGTTTQVDLLAGYLRNEKPEQKILITKEPTNNIIGGLIRGCLTGDWKTTPDGLQLLFAADRAHHLSQAIEPALRDHYIVICDRYYLSSIAYGSIDCDQEWIYKINKKFRRPDLTFFIDVTAETAMERMKKIRYNVELFERKAILEKVRKNYLDAAQKEKNLYIINGEEIITRVRDDINKFINKYLDM
ncbi:MAG: dTMP kinase [Candidatus Doudnabacteria bacterium]